jgi:hypothetical protein
LTEPSHDIKPSSGGFFETITTQIKLILRLMGDLRVNPLLKLLPIGSLLYWFIPDLAIGPIDDALVLWLGTTLFIELCPEEIVREHRDALTSVVEGQFREIDEDEETEPEKLSNLDD